MLAYIAQLLESRTIWTLAVTAISGVLTSVFGADAGLTPEQQTNVLTGLITIGTVVAGFFRARATKVIGQPPLPDDVTDYLQGLAGATLTMHDSDCATHNEPAMPRGPCNCRLSQVVGGPKP